MYILQHALTGCEVGVFSNFDEAKNHAPKLDWQAGMLPRTWSGFDNAKLEQFVIIEVGGTK
jgi:hypothetical protein